MTSVPPSFDVEPSASNHFSWMRTLLSLQRTLMSAVRTAVSLIGFGFTVAQFFEAMRDKLPAEMRTTPLDVPRDLGLLLVGAGVISLLLYTTQYHAAVAYLRSGEFAAIAAAERRSFHGPTYLIAWTVVLIGVAAFVSVLLRF